MTAARQCPTCAGTTQSTAPRDAAPAPKIAETIAALVKGGKTVIFVGMSPSGHDDFGAKAVMKTIMNGTFTQDAVIPSEKCRDSTRALAERAATDYGDRFSYISLEPYFLKMRDGRLACFMTVNSLPWPGPSLAALTEPPCSWTSRRTTASPMPEL